MNKKGFTLIELLAVIVILAIIALIAVPIVLGIIEDSRKSETLRSAEHYLNGVEQAVARAMLNGNATINPNGTYSINDNGDICIGTDCIEVEVDGEKPRAGGTIKLENGSISEATLTLNSKTIVLADGNLDYENQENGGNNDAVEQAGLYDAEGNLLASWDELVNDYGLDIETDYENPTAAGTMNSVFTNNENLSNGVKLVIDNSITKIGDVAVYDCSNLQTILIPNSVTSIGFGAFAESGLVDITIPESVTSIGAATFMNSSNLESVTILGNITEISDNTFDDCKKLKNVVLPGSVEIIGQEAFKSCISLESITLPSNLTTIKSSAFSSTGLKSIVIPNSVTSIGTSIFSKCTNLTSITYNGTASGYPWGAPNITVE